MPYLSTLLVFTFTEIPRHEHYKRTANRSSNRHVTDGRTDTASRFILLPMVVDRHTNKRIWSCVFTISSEYTSDPRCTHATDDVQVSNERKCFKDVGRCQSQQLSVSYRNVPTPWAIKSATLFSIITPAFPGRFLYILYKWKQEWILVLYREVNKIYHFTLTVSPHYKVKLKQH